MAVDTSIALVTLDDARAFVGKKSSETEDDAILEILIDGVSERFNAAVGRRLLEQTEATAYLDGNGRQTLLLPRYPNVSLAGLTEGGVALVEGEDQDYRLYPDTGILVRLGAGRWAHGRKNIVLSSYKAGWAQAALPKDLKLAALVQIAADYQDYRTHSWGELSRSFSDGSVTRREEGEFLSVVKATLEKYRSVRI